MVTPKNNKVHLQNLLIQNIRPSLRAFKVPRELEIDIQSNGSVLVTLGSTKVHVQVSAEISKPFEERPFEGLFNISCELPPLFINNGLTITAATSTTNNDDQIRQKEIEISRLIEKAIKKSNSIDIESLCIQAGKKCWSIRIDLHFFKNDGGIVDAGCVAAMCGLLSFKKQDVEVVNGEIVIYSEKQRVGVGLGVLGVPICVTIGWGNIASREWLVKKGDSIVRENMADVNDSGDVEMKVEEEEEEEDEEENNGIRNVKERTKILPDIMLVDPTIEEMELLMGTMTVTLNSNRELCQISKSGGLPISMNQIMESVELCAEIAKDWTDKIKQAVKIYEAKQRDPMSGMLSVVNDRE
ncbi:exosome non-catalytic core subunit [Martiniozyma asiatica (nom. inval.)]|nr:exosome non-catalytic core subunit [Martiniozyma asiatica]